ncbi:hypothetical protein CUJ83_09650 [Methanocella sp. CWC-04]|uniref:Dinitrogenase iron-molybdenum cofactor biosynthesis domain-containing protein n=2 Tax=Methanooceanicella nereidis TaxID=2052831 RepID=A0AAP2RFI0_9EURY|nr:hypothetical protein [Methanocella sp. CWC-04]
MTRIAVPSMTPHGIDSEISAHFGSCEHFTLIDITEGIIEGVTSIENISHEGAHNCAAPANLLKANNVDIVLVSGIGGRPLMSLTGNGIKVYGGAIGTVRDAIEDLTEGMLDELSDRGTCNCSH